MTAPNSNLISMSDVLDTMEVLTELYMKMPPRERVPAIYRHIRCVPDEKAAQYGTLVPALFALLIFNVSRATQRELQLLN